MKRIMVTGALGQIGSELVVRLRQLCGENAVLATDIRQSHSEAALSRTRIPFVAARRRNH
jgi:nucleoside-diphosphate-sugar epimerase